LEKYFRETIGNRIEEKVEVVYAYQEVSDIPSTYSTKFANRSKPWGTGQAVLACKDIVKEPFLAINADDYYGRDAYQVAYNYLTDGDNLPTPDEVTDTWKDSDIIRDKMKVMTEIAMVSFVLNNTLSEFGAVTRGICKKNSEGYLESVVETANIFKRGNQAVVIEGEKEEPIDVECLASMNIWCMFPGFFRLLEIGFEKFLEELSRDNQEENYLKAEYLLPGRIGELLDKGELQVKVLESKDSWFGVTYKEDKEVVIREINKLIEEGLYPDI
jgi:hypothetical protein